MEPTNSQLMEAIQALTAHHEMTQAEHLQEHEWVRAQIARERAKAAFWAALVDKSLPTILAALAVAAAAGIWQVLKTHFAWR